MGFFKKLIKAGQKVAKVVDPIGGGRMADPLGAVTGAYDKQSGGSAGPDMTNDMGLGLDGMTGGDSTDPAYGSLLQPFDVEQFYNYADPGYAFELQQGQQAMRNAASSQSGALSGAALKDLLGYSQNFARTGYNDAFNRYQVQQGNIFSRLADIARLGQNAAAGVGAQGTQLAGNAGQALTNAGGAAGAGIVGAGNALGGGLTDYWLWKNYGGGGGVPMAGSPAGIGMPA